MAKKTKTEKALDKEIDKIYKENCVNIEIDIMDIQKIFDAGHKAASEGKDLKEAIVAIVQKIRKN